MFCAYNTVVIDRSRNADVSSLFILAFSFVASSTPLRFSSFIEKSLLLIHKKGVGACFSAYPGTTGLRIASPHRIDNAVSPRQHGLYIIMYIETHHVTLRLSSVCCGFGICEVRCSQRQTFENVFLIYMTARFTPKG